MRKTTSLDPNDHSKAKRIWSCEGVGRYKVENRKVDIAQTYYLPMTIPEQTMSTQSTLTSKMGIYHLKHD